LSQSKDDEGFQIVDWSNVVAAVITGCITIGLFLVRNRHDSGSKAKSSGQQQVIAEQVEFRKGMLEENQHLRKENRELWSDLEDCRSKYKKLYKSYIHECKNNNSEEPEGY